MALRFALQKYSEKVVCMRSLGLKLNITGTLVLLLTLAILLGNAVVILLWHRGLVMGEVRQMRTIAGLWSELVGGSTVLGGVSSGDLDVICRAVGESCRGVIYYDGRTLVSASASVENSSLEEATRLAARSRRDVVRFSESTAGGFIFGEKQLIVALPVAMQNKKTMGLGLVVALQTAYQIFQQHQKIVLVYMLVNVILLTVIGLFRLLNIVVRPIERLVKTSEAYDYSDGLVFSNEQTGSEIGQLSLALNRMLARIEEDRQKLRDSVKSLEQANAQLLSTQKEMLRAEKLAAVGRLSAGLAHEIGNPIGIVQGYLELLENADLSPDERLQFSRRAVSELQRISNLIQQLLNFARTSSQELEPVAVQALLDELVGVLATQKKDAQVEFVRECAGQDDIIVANAIELRQVFLNCLLNAFDSIEEMGNGYAGRLTLTCRCIGNAKGKPLVRVTIADNGIGIKEKHLETIFDPFFTTKPPGKGTGLGLSVSHAIIEAAGGRIWAESSGVSGAAIIIELPVAEKSLPDTPSKTSTGP